MEILCSHYLFLKKIIYFEMDISAIQYSKCINVFVLIQQQHEASTVTLILRIRESSSWILIIFFKQTQILIFKMNCINIYFGQSYKTTGLSASIDTCFSLKNLSSPLFSLQSHILIKLIRTCVEVMETHNFKLYSWENNIFFMISSKCNLR